MAFNPKIYPPYWRQFSEYIRFVRAGGKCERCGAPNGEIVERGYLDAGKETPVWWDEGATYDARSGKFLGWYRSYEIVLTRLSKIVLTVAHLDHRGGVCQCKRIFGVKCAKPSHVLALCQSCHLSLDRPKHLAVQAKNRALKKDAQRGLLNLI